MTSEFWGAMVIVLVVVSLYATVQEAFDAICQDDEKDS